MAVSQDQVFEGVVAPPLPLSRVQRVRIWVLRFLKGATITWLCTVVLAFQAHTFDAEQPAPHPLQKLLDAGAVQVDTTSITVVSQIVYNPSYELGAWKRLLKGVVGLLGAGVHDAPQTWELVAEERDGYRALRYEGRGLQGTHWVVTAYQMGHDGTLYVTLRSELRGLPKDLRLSAYELQKQLQYGIGQPVKHYETRIVVSGRTDAAWGRSPTAFAETLLHTLNGTDTLRVKEEPGAVSVAGYTPYLERSLYGPTNIEVQLMPEGDRTRITVGTPYLGSVESSLVTGRTLTHTSLASGHTSLAR